MLYLVLGSWFLVLGSWFLLFREVAIQNVTSMEGKNAGHTGAFTCLFFIAHKINLLGDWFCEGIHALVGFHPETGVSGWKLINKLIPDY
jgi:hypothetical protein